MRAWRLLAVLNLVIAIAHAASGEWQQAFSSFTFAWLDAYIAYLLADRARYVKVFQLVYGGAR